MSADYRQRSGLVLGFHGCDREVGEKILASNSEHLKLSTNDYDWLGKGVYFWENDPQRALEFAQEAHAKPKLSKGYIAEPFVIGAVLDLRFCLDMQERTALDELQIAYQVMERRFRAEGKPMPVNKGEDRGQRFLDGAVIDALHEMRDLLNTHENTDGQFPPYHSVRGAFWEGGELFPGAAGFEKKSHVQIAVRDVACCIKGYFRPLV